MKNIVALQIIKRIFPYIFISFCSLLMSLYGTNNPFQIGFSGSDSSVFIYVAKEILDGGMPYRDTFDHKGPLIYLIDALGLAIDEQIGIWIIELITIFVIFLFAYKIARLLRCNYYLSCIIVVMGLFVLSCYFQGGNLTEEYACAFIIVSFYFFLEHFIYGEFSRAVIILWGVSFAAICILRINMIALWIVMCLGVMGERVYKRRKKGCYIFICWFLIGTAIVIIPITLWLLKNNAFSDFVNDYFIFNLMYSSDPERASFFKVIDAIMFFIMGPPLVLTLPFLCYFCVKQKKLIDWLCTITILLSVVLSCISGQKYEHYGMIWYPFVIYAFGRILNEFLLLKENTKKLKIIKISLFFSYSCLFFYYFIPFLFFFTNRTISTVFSQNDVLPYEKQMASVIQSLTDEKDRITIVGNNDTFYLLSNRKSASKYSYQYPVAKIYPKIWEEYFVEICQLKAKVIVLPTSTRNSYPFNKMLKIVNNNYNLVEIFSGYETYEIYLLKKNL